MNRIQANLPEPASQQALMTVAGAEIVLAEPRGFCAGVDRAIEIVERALQKFGRPIYVRHEIVHNTFVVNDLKSKGAIFIEDLAEVPPGATLVFSAHGVSQAVQREAQARGFRIFDATCPLVTKVHVEVAKLHREGLLWGYVGIDGLCDKYPMPIINRFNCRCSPTFGVVTAIRPTLIRVLIDR